MGREYKITFPVPGDYDPSALLRKLPNPMHPEALCETYSYAVEPDGFYFVDHLVDRTVAAVALQGLLDEALQCTDVIELTQL
jgi:hypothetical protein